MILNYAVFQNAQMLLGSVGDNLRFRIIYQVKSQKFAHYKGIKTGAFPTFVGQNYRKAQV